MRGRSRISARSNYSSLTRYLFSAKWKGKRLSKRDNRTRSSFNYDGRRCVRPRRRLVRVLWLLRFCSCRTVFYEAESRTCFFALANAKTDECSSIFRCCFPPRRINSYWLLVREREIIANSCRAVYNRACYGIQLFLRPLAIVDRFLSYFTWKGMRSRVSSWTHSLSHKITWKRSNISLFFKLFKLVTMNFVTQCCHSFSQNLFTFPNS